MSLLLMEGFDQYQSITEFSNSERWYGTDYASATYQWFETGRTGSGQCMRMNRYGDLMHRMPDQTDDTLIVGFATRISSSTNQSSRLNFWNEDNVYLFGCYSAAVDGDYQFINGDSGVLATITIGLYTWAYIEIRVYIHPTAGTLKVRVNETEVVNLTGLDTTANAASSHVPTKLAFTTDYSGGICQFDDIYVCNSLGTDNNDFLGDCQVTVLKPTADSGTPDWTRSAGSNNYENVDEVPASDTTYNYTSTSGDTDLFTFEALSYSPASIYAVQANTSVNKSAPGSANVILHCNTGANTNESSDKWQFTTLYGSQSLLLEYQTGTTAWDKSAVDAIIAGYELV